MDRFIVHSHSLLFLLLCDLKSNMDRFIVQDCFVEREHSANLKSNMDRFIEVGNYTLDNTV